MDTANKLTQAETACNLIRFEILDGQLLPGAKLNIKALESRLDVSLGAIREALSRLHAEGLVRAEAQRGYTVVPVSAEELRDLTKTRVEIDALCLREAMQNGNIEWEARIVGAAHRMERLQDLPSAVEGGRATPLWNQAHGEFHDALVSACPSAWLLRIRKLLYGQSERYRRLAVPLESQNRDVRGEHRRLMDAVLARDEAAVLKEIDQHISATAEVILKSLKF
jgi:GntR family transcriptional regulator, carbon starvation induced regulator